MYFLAHSLFFLKCTPNDLIDVPQKSHFLSGWGVIPLERDPSDGGGDAGVAGGSGYCGGDAGG